MITASGFRRTQTKAQVFSLEENATVRTRLTHTLEVATYGEWLAQNVFERLSDERSIDGSLALPFTVTVENACLLHDIGNPPFGHLGEFAIQDWFNDETREERIKKTWRDAEVPEEDVDLHYLSFKHFDGNPQGLRIVSRLQWLEDEYGLNLTCSLLAAIVKYLAIRPNGDPFSKKIGFFATEIDRIKEVWKILDLKTDEKGLPKQRFPLTFLMEAADDIAYCVSDIEDALEKKIIRENDLFDKLPSDLARFKPDPAPASPQDYEAARNATFIRFKTALIRHLAKAAEDAYVDHHDSILSGSFNKPLLKCDKTASKALDFLKRFTRKHVFESREAIDVEMSGFRILQTLLDRFENLITMPSDDFRKICPATDGKPARGESEIERRLATLLPHKHLMCYKHSTQKHENLEPIYRAHLIVDYLAGMTDTHSVKVFKVLTGTEAGMSL